MKRIIFSEEAKADIRAIPQHIAMNILTAIHRLAEHGSGRIKELKGKEGEKRLRVGDHRVRFTPDRRAPRDSAYPHRQESQGRRPLSSGRKLDGNFD